MHRTSRNLDEQVVLITGASSGIGLVTARLAAEGGAAVVAVSRDDGALKQLAAEIKGNGGEALAVAADVADAQAVQAAAEQAVKAFDRIDTWVNNAGVSMYGRLDEVALADHRRLFDTNFWGVVHGSLTASETMAKGGGTIINVGSVLSDFTIPLQAMYCASKHAVKGFTDGLRMELEEAGMPIAVCLVKPSAIDTPYTTHARNYMDVKPKNPAPVYDPQLVAEAILHCAEHPRREITVGGGGRAMSAAANWLPRLTDLIMEKVMFGQQQTDEPVEQREGSLYAPDDNLQERGEYDGYVRKHTAYTSARLHPVSTALAALASGAAVAAGTWLTRELAGNLHSRRETPASATPHRSNGKRRSRGQRGANRRTTTGTRRKVTRTSRSKPAASQ